MEQVTEILIIKLRKLHQWALAQEQQVRSIKKQIHKLKHILNSVHDNGRRNLQYLDDHLEKVESDR